MKKIFILFIIYKLSLTLAFCGGGAGTTGMNFLKIGAGARQAAMGGAAVGLADDVYSIYYNPAGSAALKQNEATFMHTVWFENISYEYVSFVCPLENSVAFGGNVSILNHKDIQGYDAGGTETGVVPAYDLLVVLSAARMVSKYHRGDSGLFAGANVKLIQEKLDDVSTTVLAFDAAGLYKPGWDVAGGSVRFGINVQNIGTKIRYISTEGGLPLNVKFGAAYTREVSNGRMSVAVDGNVPVEREFYLCAGAEYWHNDFVALRLGYNSNRDLSGAISCGIGVRGVSSKFSFQVDHAFVPYDKLSDTHRLSISIKF